MKQFYYAKKKNIMPRLDVHGDGRDDAREEAVDLGESNAFGISVREVIKNDQGQGGNMDMGERESNCETLTISKPPRNMTKSELVGMEEELKKKSPAPALLEV